MSPSVSGYHLREWFDVCRVATDPFGRLCSGAYDTPSIRYQHIMTGTAYDSQGIAEVANTRSPWDAKKACFVIDALQASHVDSSVISFLSAPGPSVLGRSRRPDAPPMFQLFGISTSVFKD